MSYWASWSRRSAYHLGIREHEQLVALLRNLREVFHDEAVSRAVKHAAEEGSRKVADADAVVPVEARDEEVTAALHQPQHVELIGSLHPNTMLAEPFV